MRYLFFILLFLAACTITSFEECVEAGNLVVESYPRQCRAQGRTFVEEFGVQEPCSGEVCTDDPVCGFVPNEIRCIKAPCPSFDAVTFDNECAACAANAFEYYAGTCDEQELVVCEDTATGFDSVKYARDNDGICVDVCPGNYDPYVTQIGVKLCIKHYGLEEVKQWPPCEQSSTDCNCVRAYETTTGAQIKNAKYRCVPERYANRLLFRGGLDQLGEQGQKRVAIA